MRGEIFKSPPCTLTLASYQIYTQRVVKMAPRATPAESSRAAQRKAARPPPPAAAPAPVKASIGTSKKRAAPPPVEEDEEDEGFLNGDTFEMSDDEMIEGSDEEEGDDEAFPELDSGSDEGDDDDEDEEEDDEEDGSESGYNSSDIERLEDEDDEDEESPSTTPSSSQENLTIDEKLSRMIAKNFSKPDEAIGTDGKISLAKDGKGRMVKSKFVEGSYIREYDEYEAGYGSESSTEDVS